MAVGLRFEQKLRGTYHRLADPGVEHAAMLETEVELRLADLARGRDGRVRGRIRLDEYADSELEGTFKVDLFERKIVYDFRFDASDDRPRRFHGETVFELRRPIRTMEDLVGRIYDDEIEDARLVIRVPLDVGTRRLLRTLRASLTRSLSY